MNNNPFSAPVGQRSRMMAAYRANTLFEALAVSADSGSNNIISVARAGVGSTKGPWATFCGATNAPLANDGSPVTTTVVSVATPYLPNGAFGVTPTGQYGRPATQVNLGTTDYGYVGIAGVGMPVNFVNENDSARLRFAFRIDTGFHDDLGIILGLGTPFSVATTTLISAPISGADLPAFTSGSVGTDYPTFMGLVKKGGAASTGTATPFNAGFVDDGTVSSLTQIGGNLAANIWYDVDIEWVKGSSTNQGYQVATIGQNTLWESEFVSRVATKVETSTLFPDADQALVPIIAFAGNDVNSITFWGGEIEFGAWRRPLR